MNSGKIIGLDVKTGNEIQSFVYPSAGADRLNLQNNANVLNCYTYLDSANHHLFGIYAQYYWEIDLRSFDFIYHDLEKSCSISQIGQMQYAAHEKRNIFFFDNMNNGRFGKFDQDRKEIVWTTEIAEVKGKFPAIRKIAYSNKRLFVLDHLQTLHIFQDQ